MTRAFSRRALAGGAAAAGLLLATVISGPAQAATAWTVLNSPNRGTVGNELYGAAALSSTSAWAVGSWYDNNLASSRTMVQRWNGTGWSVVSSPNATNFYNELRDVDATSATNAWAVGYANGSSGVNGMPATTLAMRWNGTAWSITPTPNPGVNYRQLYGVKTFSPTDVWAVGWYYDASFFGDTLALHWNGTSWSQVTVPAPGTSGNALTAVAGAADNDVWAVGYYRNTGDQGGLTHPLALHYNGSTWTESPMPETAAGGYLRGVTALAANDVWAVGTKNGYSTPLAYHWNGTAWSEVPTAGLSGAGGNNILYAVTGSASNQVWAVGYQSVPGGAQPLVQRWNGTAFVNETVPTLPLGGVLYAAAATTGPTVFGAGTQTASGTSGNFVDSTLSIRGTGS